MGNPWDVTPWPKVGNAGHDELFLAVGKALSNWELVENAIAGLFTRVTVGSYYAPTAPAIRAYSAVMSASNRIQMVRAALESWLHVWKDCPSGRNALDILKECGEWVGRRNDIAHGIVDRVVDAPKHGWFLFPSFYNAKKRPLDDRPAYRYTAAPPRMESGTLCTTGMATVSCPAIINLPTTAFQFMLRRDQSTRDAEVGGLDLPHH